MLVFLRSAECRHTVSSSVSPIIQNRQANGTLATVKLFVCGIVSGAGDEVSSISGPGNETQ